MTDETFGEVVRRIQQFAGETFWTVTGLPLTYVIEGDTIKIDRVKVRVASLRDARKVWEMGSDVRPSEIDQRMVGRSYLVAILRDRRISGALPRPTLS